MTVDEYIEAKVMPEHRGMVARLRKIMRESAPDATELISYGVYHVARQARADQERLTLSFPKGAPLGDQRWYRAI
jgi:uncharacterized protein YdhG (YjbR/CyaY superfamily)